MPKDSQTSWKSCNGKETYIDTHIGKDCDPKKLSKCNMIFIVLAFVFSRLLFGDHSYYVGPGKAFPNSIPGLTSTSKMQFVTGIVGEVEWQ